MIDKKPDYWFILFLVAILSLLLPPVAAAPLIGTLTPISVGTPAAHHWDPAISGNYIVWSDDRTGYQQIYLYDLSTGTERQLSNGTANKRMPSVSGHYVVWEDNRFQGAGNGQDIVLYDLSTDSSIRIANGTNDQTNPSIEGDLVVWQDRRNGVNTNIFLYSISSTTETQVSHASGNQVKPRVSNDIIVWENNTYSPYKVAMYDYTGNRTPFQPIDFGVDEDQNDPSIRNNHLVWSDNHADLTYYRIYMEDITTGEIQDIAPDDDDHFFPDVDGTRYAWIQDNEIYLNDTAVPDSLTQVTSTGTTKNNVKISGNRIVWREDFGTSDMIYMFTIGSAETCPVADFTIAPSRTGAIPFAVTFTDTSSNPAGNPISHWHWDFGDGHNSTVRNPPWTYGQSGNYDVRLTVDNALCRNETPVNPAYRINAGAAPIAGISASTTSGMIPLTVTYTDTSGAATAWNWSFGDGTYAETSPATHTYSTGGTYTVRLNASNTWGYSYATTTIHALTGANENFNANIEGIVIQNRFGGQFLVYNGTHLPGYNMPAGSLLISPPLPNYGWQNITFRNNDGIGFHEYPNNTIMGNLSGVIFQSFEIHPVGFSSATGSLSSVNYTMDLTSYPVGGSMNTQIWEGVIPSDLANLEYIAYGSGWSHILATAYTIKNTEPSFNPNGPAKIHFSVSSTLVVNNLGRDHTYLIRIGDDGRGEVLPTRFLFNDPVKNLDYFESDSPRGLCTFGITQLAGSGNPLQLITLTVTSHINPPSSASESSDSDTGGAGGGKGAGITAAIPTSTPGLTATSTPVPADPGKSAKVYTNANGVVTQATRLQSTDGHVLISVGEGVVAMDAGGKPLSEITVKALRLEDLPAIPSGSTFTFAGMAYDIGPDGATFSPPASLSFTLPQVQWGQDYSVKTFDTKSGTWQDLPTTFDATTGTITAQASHLCTFALFAQSRAPAVTETAAATPLPVPVPPQAQAPPPSTAVSIFTDMMGWVTVLVVNNIIPLAGFIFLGLAGYLVMLGRFPGSGQ